MEGFWALEMPRCTISISGDEITRDCVWWSSRCALLIVFDRCMIHVLYSKGSPLTPTLTDTPQGRTWMRGSLYDHTPPDTPSQLTFDFSNLLLACKLLSPSVELRV